MGGFDLICKDNVDKITKNTVRLGCNNNRISVMKKLAAMINNRTIIEAQEKSKKEE